MKTMNKGTLISVLVAIAAIIGFAINSNLFPQWASWLTFIAAILAAVLQLLQQKTITALKAKIAMLENNK